MSAKEWCQKDAFVVDAPDTNAESFAIPLDPENAPKLRNAPKLLLKIRDQMITECLKKNCPVGGEMTVVKYEAHINQCCMKE